MAALGRERQAAHKPPSPALPRPHAQAASGSGRACAPSDGLGAVRGAPPTSADGADLGAARSAPAAGPSCTAPLPRPRTPLPRTLIRAGLLVTAEAALLPATLARAMSGRSAQHRRHGTERTGSDTALAAATVTRCTASPRRLVALLVHDALGFDERTAPYVTQLEGAGFLVLEMELRALSLDGAGAVDDATAGAADAAKVLRAAKALSRHPAADPQRLAAVGFGAELDRDGWGAEVVRAPDA